MTQPLTPTEADKNAAQAWWNGTDGLRTAEFNSLAEAFARHAQAARLEGARAMQEAAVSVADEHAKARRDASKRAKEAKNRSEARDHESMAIEAAHILISIRSLDPLSIAEKGV